MTSTLSVIVARVPRKRPSRQERSHAFLCERQSTNGSKGRPITAARAPVWALMRRIIRIQPESGDESGGRPGPRGRRADDRDHLLDEFCCSKVISPVRDAIGQFPARRLSPDEHALVVEWLAAAGDVISAFVSNRRSDDPALHHRIVITTGPDDGPSHYNSCAERPGHLDRFRLWPTDEGSAFSKPAGCIELHSACPCGSRVGKCAWQGQAGRRQAPGGLQPAQGRLGSAERARARIRNAATADDDYSAEWLPGRPTHVSGRPDQVRSIVNE
jgi:hypothetical protein